MNLLEKILLVFRTLKNPGTFIMDYLGLLHGELIYKIRNSSVIMHLRAGTTDKDEVVVVLSGYEYDLPTITQNLGEFVCIFDLGGHIGSFSVFAGKALSEKKLSIYTFEPSTTNFALLSKNIVSNHLEKVVQLLHAAVGPKHGTVVLDTSTNTDGYFVRQSSDKVDSSSETVEMLTIQEVARRNNVEKIDLIKMDIEGGEYALFNDAGTFDFIKKHVSSIVMETHELDESRNQKALIVLLEKDFTVHVARPNILYIKNEALATL
jgi:FkbM family methyltransferase